jgi:hypothetical protein
MTRKHEPIQESDIQASLRPISSDEYFIVSQTMREEQAIHWFVADIGMVVPGSSAPRGLHLAILERRLRGSANKLNAGTLISTRRRSYPRELTPETFKAYKEVFPRNDQELRTIGRIAIMEPGLPIINPLKTEFTGYVDLPFGANVTSSTILTYLNNPDGFISGAEATTLEHELHTVDKLKKQRKANEEKVLDEMFKSGEIFKVLGRLNHGEPEELEEPAQ